MHPRIFCAKEEFIKPEILFPKIDYLIENKELPEEFLEIFIVDNEFKTI